MAWAYNSTTKILTATGGTQASPNLLSAGVAIVAAADSTSGYQNGLYNRLNNVQIDNTVSAWVKWDDYAIFEFTGSTRYNPYGESSSNANNGGSTILGMEMVCNVNTSTTYFDNNAIIVNTGGTLITLRSPAGRNPYFYQQTSTRNDFPTFPLNIFPAVINIAGLTIRQNAVSGASRKAHFGLARTVTAVSNVNFEGVTGEFQTALTTYTGYQSPIMVHSGESVTNTSSFYSSAWGAENTGTVDFAIGASARLGNYINYNPIFPTVTWTGTYTSAGLYWSADNRYAAALYSHTPTFKLGSTKLANIVVQWLGTQTTGTTSYTISNIGETLSKNATTTSTGTVSNYLLSAMIGRQSGANGTSNKYQWSCKARAYNYITADQYLWTARSFLSDGTNGPVTEDVQLLTVPYLTLTQSQAAALTGISLVASGTTGGVITLTSNHTASEVWAYYRNWISTLANFGSNDTWEFDGTTLTIGGWTLTGLEYLTSGKLTASTATATAQFTASVTGNVIQNTPTNLTGVTITGSLTYNTNTAISVTHTNCETTGTTSNSGTATVTIINVNSTFTAGTNIATYKPVSFTYNLDGGSILIKKPDNTVLGFYNSDGIINFTNANQQGTYTIRVPKFGKQTILSSFVVDTTAGTAISTFNASFITDTFVDDTLTNVLLYTELNDVQTAYNYSSYYRTLQEGIDVSNIISKQFTSLTVNAPVEIKNTTLVNNKLIYWDNTTVFIKSSVFGGTQTVYVSGNFTLTGTTLGDDIKIRATNINSEIIATGYLPIRYYATSSNRRTDTNCFLIQTTNVHRFLYGTGGLTGTVYILSGTAEAKKDVTIIDGTTIISLDVSDKVDLVAKNVWEYDVSSAGTSVMAKTRLKKTLTKSNFIALK